MTNGMPRLIATVGLHGSASTWVFNVLRELMEASLGPTNVLAMYEEDAATLLNGYSLANKYIVLKSHRGGAGWDSLLWLTQAPIFMSIRDPRDATVSLVQRFNVSLRDAAQAIYQDCHRCEQCADAGRLILRYEDKFFEDNLHPGRIAETLGISLDKSVLQNIFERYSTASVKTFASSLEDLPAHRAVLSGNVVEMDAVTQIHRTHIGDGQIGKWRFMLKQPDGKLLTNYFATFLTRFNYEF